MFGGGMDQIPEQLKEIIRNSSEAEVTEIVMMSLKEAMRDPDAFAKQAGIPPMLASGLKMMPKTDDALRPMAKMMAQMLIKQVKTGKQPSFDDLKDTIPGASSFMQNLMGNSGMNEADLASAMNAGAPAAIENDVSRKIDESIRLKQQEKFEEAEDVLKEALQQCTTDSAAKCQVLNNLATTQLILEKYDDAEANLKEFLKLSDKYLQLDDHHIASSYFGLAMVREAQNKTADADLLYKKALSVAENAYANSPLELAHMLETLGNFYEGQKLWRKSDSLYQRAHSLREKALGADNLDVAEQYVRFALIQENREHFSEAEMFCLRALQTKFKLMPPDDSDLARNQALLASIYVGQKEYGKAEPILKASIAVLEKNGDDEELIYPLEVYARLCNETDRASEASEMSKRVAALSEE